MSLSKEELVNLMIKLSEEGLLKATWEGIIVDIKNVTINNEGVIIIDANQY